MIERGEGLVVWMAELERIDEKIPSAQQGAFEVEKYDRIGYGFVQGYSFCTKSYSKVLNVVQIINEKGEGMVI